MPLEFRLDVTFGARQPIDEEAVASINDLLTDVSPDSPW